MKNPKEQLQEEKRGFFSNLYVCIGLRTFSNYPADSITILVTKCFYILTRAAENTSLECRRKFNTFEAVTRWSSFYFSAFRWPGVARTAHTESNSLRVSALSNKHARCVASPSEFILICFLFIVLNLLQKNHYTLCTTVLQEIVEIFIYDIFK